MTPVAQMVRRAHRLEQRIAEQSWCPIKHARPVPFPHSHYQAFVDYGDAAGYHRELPALRRALRAHRKRAL